MRVRAGAMLASARARVAALAAPSHGRRTGVSVCVAAMAASSRGHDACVCVSLFRLLYRVGMMHVRVCMGTMLASAVCRSLGCFVARASYRCERVRRRHGCFIAWA